MIFPNQCYIELTQKCNLRCFHCFAQATPDALDELSFEQVVEIYEQLPELNPIYLNISGGEPILVKDFYRIIEYAAKQPYITNLLTNGTLWTKDSIEKFADCVPDRNIIIQISLDGPFEIMAKHRNMDLHQYKQIFESAFLFRELGFTVMALSVVDAVTAPYILDTVKDALVNGYFNNIKMVPLFMSGRALNNIDLLEGFWDSWSNIVKEVTEIRKYAIWGELSKKVSLGFFTLYELVAPLDQYGMLNEALETWGLDIFDINKYRQQIRRNYYCECGFSELTISSEMNVFPCVASIRSSLNCGSLNKNRLSKIWAESDLLNWYRSEKHDLQLKEPCNSCQFKDFCGGGCRLTSLSLYGNLNSIDNRCPYVIKYNKTMTH